MLILQIGILSPAPPLYCWYIYDVDKGPIMSVRHSDCIYDRVRWRGKLAKRRWQGCSKTGKPKSAPCLPVFGDDARRMAFARAGSAGTQSRAGALAAPACMHKLVRLRRDRPANTHQPDRHRND